VPIGRADGGGRPPAARRGRRVPTRQAGGAIRRLWPSERGKVRDHLLRLDRDDRLLRFGAYASAAQIAAYCARLDWRRGLIVGYVTGGKVRGIGELKLLGTGWPRAAELAVSVERRFQNRGIGTALLRRLVVAARNRLLERIHMVCLMDNGRAVRMARRLDGTMRFAQGEAEARIEPPWPTPWTWLEEALPESVFPGLDRERAALPRLSGYDLS
jgi:ribosomal protein S18 acetylase RimI-like enzyme